MTDKSKYRREEDAESAEKLNPTNEHSFEDAFEQTGHGRLNHLVLFTSGLIMLNVSMESVGMSYAITAAECELKLTSKDKGLVNAAAFIDMSAAPARRRRREFMSTRRRRAQDAARRRDESQFAFSLARAADRINRLLHSAGGMAAGNAAVRGGLQSRTKEPLAWTRMPRGLQGQFAMDKTEMMLVVRCDAEMVHAALC